MFKEAEGKDRLRHKGLLKSERVELFSNFVLQVSRCAAVMSTHDKKAKHKEKNTPET